MKSLEKTHKLGISDNGLKHGKISTSEAINEKSRKKAIGTQATSTPKPHLSAEIQVSAKHQQLVY